MIEPVVNQYAPDEVSPPGETLREVLAERGITQAELATRMGRPQKTISEIINAKAAITPETALQLELVLGIPARFWTSREQHYRDHLAAREQRLRLAEQVQWARSFPVKKMTEAGFIEAASSPTECVRKLLEFFAVASPDQWQQLHKTYRVAFRKSAAFQADTAALSAWLRAGEIEADRIQCEPYNRERFISSLWAVRSLTGEDPATFHPAMVDLCKAAGVAVAFVPELPRSRASGATRWLAPSKALIQLSLRYRTDDHLWFTFFHEAAHILLHGKRLIFLEGIDHGGTEEEEANRWASDFLIPRESFETLREEATYSKEWIVAWADQIGVSPGIIVGRLQHEGLLPHTHGNDLKRRFEWAKEHTR